jgi:hypothetical protein
MYDSREHTVETKLLDLAAARRKLTIRTNALR